MKVNKQEFRVMINRSFLLRFCYLFPIFFEVKVDLKKYILSGERERVINYKLYAYQFEPLLLRLSFLGFCFE